MKTAFHSISIAGTVRAVTIAACFGIVIAGCTPKSDDTAPSPAASTAPDGKAAGGGDTSKKLHLAFITNNASDFWTIARKGTEQAEKEVPNIDVQFKIPDDGSAAGQKRIVDDLLAAGIDGFAISPKDPANETQMLNDAAKKALVLTQDSDAPASDRTCYVGTDNVAAGHMAGQLIKQAIPEGGKIVLFVGALDAQNAKERKQGIEEELKGSNVKIADTRTDDADPAKAKSNAADILVKMPDVACLVGLWSYNGPAILSAVKDVKKTGKIPIVCFDEQDETLDGVKSGAIYGTVVQQPYEFGRQSMELMASILRGDKSKVPASKKIIVPTLAIRVAEVDAFRTKLNMQRGRGGADAAAAPAASPSAAAAPK